jgi:3-deoxy-D-arabino-heptulosonate 7-phosphate (DAHP) synthase
MTKTIQAKQPRTRKTKTKTKAEAKKSPALSKVRKATSAKKKSILNGGAFSFDESEMIREAAYYIAEKNGFQRNKELDYWLQAEAEIGTHRT